MKQTKSNLRLNRVRDLENINSTLICEIDDLKALLKAKGIL